MTSKHTDLPKRLDAALSADDVTTEARQLVAVRRASAAAPGEAPSLRFDDIKDQLPIGAQRRPWMWNWGVGLMSVAAVAAGLLVAIMPADDLDSHTRQKGEVVCCGAPRLSLSLAEGERFVPLTSRRVALGAVLKAEVSDVAGLAGVYVVDLATRTAQTLRVHGQASVALSAQPWSAKAGGRYVFAVVVTELPGLDDQGALAALAQAANDEAPSFRGRPASIDALQIEVGD
jgi:hypothetical protein